MNDHMHKFLLGTLAAIIIGWFGAVYASISGLTADLADLKVSMEHRLTAIESALTHRSDTSK